MQFYEENNQNDFNNMNQNNTVVREVNNSMVAKTFLWMFAGLFITGIIALTLYRTGTYVNILLSNMYYGLLIAELAVVLLFSFLFRKMPAWLVGTLFFAYSILNGINMCWIFALYELSSIELIFFETALVFAVLSILGFTSKVDLTRFSTFLVVGLIVGIIFSIINIFIGSSVLDLILTWAMLILFFAITMYDMQRLKIVSETEVADRDKLEIYFAMQIYLDFINIFIRLLRLFGKRNS